jgi:hypothetical protein
MTSSLAAQASERSPVSLFDENYDAADERAKQTHAAFQLRVTGVFLSYYFLRLFVSLAVESFASQLAFYEVLLLL